MFTIHVPVFCMHCGKPLDAMAVEVLNRKQIIKKAEEEIEDDENDDNLDNENTIVASLDPAKLGCEPLEKPNRGIKMQDVVGTKGVAFTRPKPPKMSKNKLIEQFKREASNSKEILDIDAGQD